MVALHALTAAFLISQVCASAIPQQDVTVSTTSSVVLPSVAARSVEAAAAQLEQLSSWAYNTSTDRLSEAKDKRHGCTLSKLRIRRDWRAFSAAEKKDYIKAVRCLQELPARTPAHLAAGAKTRYDDFLATHINQTLNIHYTGTFLAWHRYFIHQFEEALREECGYRGNIPYWDWPSDAHSLEKSEVFDGSETSMSGNGKYIPNQPDIVLTMEGAADIYLPTGTGGGCVTSGPFKDYTVNLGPAALMMPGGNQTAMSNPLDYNPRCLKRDLTTELIQRFANHTSVMSLILGNNKIRDFQLVMQGVPGTGDIGVHGGGHYAMGGDPGRDVWVSPGDPAFWHHHGMIDRVWWLWQNLDRKNRQDAIAGTDTFLNNPPSPNTTLDTMVDLGYAKGKPMKMRDLMSTTAGPFCYVYL
ncbi:tyrosinase [Aspergillus sclerotialis]|uniref:Tyrosinase n=1 Tax=Aspergillus sclerotialis TaxID=2070753 RepID=A0A3A2ZL74_9EURO|nr:tyrosinase [Aspergillus sclerotialis]